MTITEWITPRPYIHLAKLVMGDIDLDPASSEVAQRNVGAQKYLTREHDGLTQQWFGRVWLSPPNGRGAMAAFTGKAIEEFKVGRITEAIILVPNSLDTAWAHRLMTLDIPFTCLQGRICFELPTRKGTTPANGQVFFYLGNQRQRFIDKFRPLGPTLMMTGGGVTDPQPSTTGLCQVHRPTGQPQLGDFHIANISNPTRPTGIDDACSFRSRTK